MRTIRLEMVLGAVFTAALLALLATTTGLDARGWGFGLATGWVATALIALARARTDAPRIHPADWVTLTRAILAAGITAVVATSFEQAVTIKSISSVITFHRPHALTTVLVLAAIALVLDGVDGQVARRTHSATPLGGRFDGEVDAFLILVLSIAAARTYGSWVLAIGLMRYAFLVATGLVPWLARTLPPRPWRKVVAAVQGIVLTVAISRHVSFLVCAVALAVALALLAESFGHDIVWLYRHGAGRISRRIIGVGGGVLAVVVVWAALVAPDQLQQLRPGAFLRVPIELLVLVAVALFLPGRVRRIVAGVGGALFGLVVVLKAFDIAFYEELGRAFDPVLDWGNLTPGLNVVRVSIGTARTNAALVAAAVILLAIIAAITIAAIHLTSVAAAHRRPAAGAVGVLAVVWAASAALSLDMVPGDPVASDTTAAITVNQVSQARAAVKDQNVFETDINSADPYNSVPASDLLTKLRGKDVVLDFVESYGQSAVENSSFSPGVDKVLAAGDASLARAGFSARSGFLVSSTFGGISWLAHSTLETGLQVSNQDRYNQVVASTRFNIPAAFKKAGWETVSDIPSDNTVWPEGTSFYHYDKLYDSLNVGYRGPSFSYATMPDQYTYSAFQRLVLTPHHKPVFAEIDTVSSHTPWTPLPHLVPWSKVGNGSIFDPQPAEGARPAATFTHASAVQSLYGQSIQYSLNALVGWITRSHDPNLVLIVLGDHQPSTNVSGPGADHDVPISIIAHDPSVLKQISSWGWTSGLKPSPSAPVWQMSSFRDHFLDAYDAPDALHPTTPASRIAARPPVR